MNNINQNKKYPYYIVEGRRFECDDKDYHLAVHFARSLATQMNRPVSIIRVLDSMTPDAVIYTAVPEKDYE